jgi:hypothetical protein
MNESEAIEMVNEFRFRSKHVKRVVLALLVVCGGAVAGASILEAPKHPLAPPPGTEMATSPRIAATASGPYASDVCVKCRNSCVDVRERCKVQACQNSGGKPEAASCRDVKNQKLWIDGLKACSDQEGLCKDQCEKGACKQ